MAVKRVLGGSVVMIALIFGGYGCPGSSNSPRQPHVTAVLSNGTYNGFTSTARVLNGTLDVASQDVTITPTVEINFSTTGAVGTTTVGVSNPLSFRFETGSGAVWNASQGLGSGSLTITTLTAAGATGTFFFTAAPDGSTGAVGNRTVMSGSFNVTF